MDISQEASMRTRPRRFTAEFRADALSMMERSDLSIREVAESLGVHRDTLRYWRKQDLMKHKKKSPSNKEKPAEAETIEQLVARLQRENAVLKKHAAQLEMDRDILKKAAAFFAKESE
ncbi:MAG: transposase [Deltaproteobacteria bacterium]|nr:transposase [Deltaproteobacteria bacterium]